MGSKNRSSADAVTLMDMMNVPLYIPPEPHPLGPTSGHWAECPLLLLSILDMCTYGTLMAIMYLTHGMQLQLAQPL